MAKKFKAKGMMALLMWIVGVIATIGLGELFIRGGFVGGLILGFLPLIVHQIVGWSIVIGAGWAVLRKFQ